MCFFYACVETVRLSTLTLKPTEQARSSRQIKPISSSIPKSAHEPTRLMTALGTGGEVKNDAHSELEFVGCQV